MKKRKSVLDKNGIMALSFGALNIADYLTTKRIFDTGGEELNPVANFFIRKNCFGILKVATTLAGMLSIYVEEKPKVVSSHQLRFARIASPKCRNSDGLFHAGS